MARLIHSRLSISRFFNTLGSTEKGRYLSTGASKFDESFKVEDAETVQVPHPPQEKLLVVGGSGFVGSHICKEALDRGLSVASLSRPTITDIVRFFHTLGLTVLIEELSKYLIRSGKPSIQEPWANNVHWHQGDLLSGGSWKEALNGVTSIVSCVGGFGSNSYMYKINGTANISVIRAAAEKGVKRFVYVSAADLGVVNYFLQGYYDGKRAAETELLVRYPYGHVILRPGFIYGNRRVGSMELPLGVVGNPLEMVLQHAKPLSQVPLVGPLLTPPINVTAVAKVAVRAAIDPVFPPGIVDVHGLMRYSHQK